MGEKAVEKRVEGETAEGEKVEKEKEEGEKSAANAYNVFRQSVYHTAVY